MTQFDCIFIPGGGLKENGSLPEWTLARVDRALELQEQTRWIALLSGGTVHKAPPLDSSGNPFYESRAAAEYLVSRGVPAEKLLTEISSYDTIGNAYFSRLLFSEPLKLKKNLAISSNFHIDRVRESFQWIYELTPLPQEYELEFENTPDLGLDPEALRSRGKKEAQSLKYCRKRGGGSGHWLILQSGYTQNMALILSLPGSKACLIQSWLHTRPRF